MKSLRVGIEASGLVAAKRSTGVQRYTRALLEHMAPLLPAYEMHLTLFFGDRTVLNTPKAQATLADLLPSSYISWQVAPTLRTYWRMTLGAMTLMDRAQLIHFPSPHIASFCPVPSVVTFHDLAALSLAGKDTQKEKRYLADALDAGRRAKHIIAVSHSAYDELLRHVPKQPVTVILEGVDPRHFSPAPAEHVQRLKTRYALDRYIVCVGTLQKRKNHIHLIQAFNAIQGEIPHQLVIIGGDGSGAQEVHDYLAAHPNPRIRLLGYVEDHDLPIFYTGADCMALPSLWEGFGLPLVEAMACGVPVLTSNVASLVEVAQGAGIIVNPTDVQAIAAGLRTLCTDANLRQQLSQAGRQRAAHYSWEQAAHQTLQLYRQIINV